MNNPWPPVLRPELRKPGAGAAVLANHPGDRKIEVDGVVSEEQTSSQSGE